MDNNTVEVLTQTLNSTIQRFTQRSQNYEVEIANLTAENISLKMQLEELQSEAAAAEAASASSKSKTAAAS